jgi:hypothetical protein
MRFKHVARYVTALCVTLLSTMAIASEVQVIQMKGTVQLRSKGQLIGARRDATLAAPVEVRTGSDGRITLRQLGSELNVGPNSVVILPEVAAARGAAQKIRQQQGTTIYSVDRKEREFIVETRHLVSVVKGTVFSVDAQEGATLVSLLEGSLEVSAPGSDEAILLRPNESATRNAGGARIEVQAASMFAPAVTASTGGVAGSLAASPEPLAVGAASVERVQADVAGLMASLGDRRAAPPVDGQPQPAPGTAPPPGPPATDPQSPGPGPEPDPTPTTPAPGHDDDHDHDHDHDDDHDDDDGNKGHGNDKDGHDDDNPGRWRWPRGR